ncbi:MAG: hypothetical protein COB10_11185 [Planctomycetota bacterium]|nr:MAG: hypothetical protein COB10_11185 [Planctomycetota bacterium]
MISLIEAGLRIIDKIIPDPEAKAEATRKLLEIQQAGELAEVEAAMNVVVAEAKSEHALTSQWRPITMLVFTAIVANNYIIAPYLAAMFGWNVMLEMPEQLWNLLSIGIGGYIVGRSSEKAIKNWKGM